MKFLVCLVVLSILVLCQAFISPKNRRLSSIVQARQRKVVDSSPPAPTIVYGENVPEEVIKHHAIYDLILIERINAPEQTAAGILLPKIEGKDQKKIGIVLSRAESYGLESEQGRVQSIDDIAPYKIGDYVYVQDPWGVGPKDFAVGDRCFSFIKADHVLAVVAK